MRLATHNLVREAQTAVDVAQGKEAWAVRAYRDAYAESIVRSEEEGGVLYATEDGWDQGPLPYALEWANNNEGEVTYIELLYRDGGPTCAPFVWEDAEKALDYVHGPEIGMLYFVRQLTYPNGRIAFTDGHQAAGLILAVFNKEVVR